MTFVVPLVLLGFSGRAHAQKPETAEGEEIFYHQLSNDKVEMVIFHREQADTWMMDRIEKARGHLQQVVQSQVIKDAAQLASLNESYAKSAQWSRRPDASVAEVLKSSFELDLARGVLWRATETWSRSQPLGQLNLHVHPGSEVELH